MAKRSNPKLIGGFVVGAIAILIVGALAFGGGEYFRPKLKAVLYFEGSLGGLDVGAPLTFRGVKVGAVTNIVIQYDVTRQVLRIPVFAEIDLDRIQVITGERSTRNLQALIDRGLRAQLQVQSFVTGQVVVNLDFYPNTPVRLVGGEPSLRELPTIPSTAEAMKANVSSVLEKISKLPLEQISAEILNVVRGADQAMKSTHVVLNDLHKVVGDLDAELTPLTKSLRATSDQANRTLVDAQKLVRDVDADVPGLVSGAMQSLKKMETALDEADKTLREAQRVLTPASPIYIEVNQTLRDIRATSASIRALAEYIQRNPNALLTGKR